MQGLSAGSATPRQPKSHCPRHTWECFEYTRMPFGLSSAPSCLKKKIMATILTGIPWVVIYLDDVVVHGLMPAVHDKRRDICVFAMPDIEFVGSHLDAKGLHPLQLNVEVVLHLPEPAYPAQVASFLGMMAHYLCFLPQYLVTPAPLCELLKKDTPRVWTPACSDAVQQLKVQLTLPPVLTHFDLTSTCSSPVRPPAQHWVPGPQRH